MEIEEFKNEVQQSVDMINNFKNGYMSAINELHEWNGGTDKPCHLDLYNRLLTMQDKMNKKVDGLLK